MTSATETETAADRPIDHLGDRANVKVGYWGGWGNET
jgi:hypothetical protein